MQQLIIIIEDSSKFPWARERISSKVLNNLGTRPRKRLVSPLQANIFDYDVILLDRFQFILALIMPPFNTTF